MLVPKCLGGNREAKYAGPCAKCLLDPVIVACPMSLGCAGLIDPIVRFKDNAFLGTAAHESVLPVGYSAATCWILVVGRALTKF